MDQKATKKPVLNPAIQNSNKLKIPFVRPAFMVDQLPGKQEIEIMQHCYVNRGIPFAKSDCKRNFCLIMPRNVYVTQVGHENARTEVPTTSRTDVPKISDLNSLQTSFPAASISTQAVKVAKIPRCQAVSVKLKSQNFVKGSSQLQYKAYKRKLPEKVCEESDPNFSRRKTHVVKDRNGLTVTSYTKILPDENESRFLSEENSKSQDHLILKNDIRQTFAIKARNVSEETGRATNLNSTINAYNNGHENARTEVPTTSRTDVPKISDLNSLQTSFPAASISTQAVKVAKIPRCQAVSVKLKSQNFVKGSSQLQYKAYKRKLPEKVCEESDPNFSRRKTYVVKDPNVLTVTSYTKILPDENESRFLSEENSKSQDHLILKNDIRQTFAIKARNVSEETGRATNLNSTINAYNNGHENARTEVPTTSQTDVPKISDLNSLQTSFPAASLSTQVVKVAKIPRCQAISSKLESENFVKGSSQLQYKAYKRKLPEKVCEESDPNFSRRKTHVVKDRNGLTVTSYTKILPDENESRFLSEENSKSQDHLIFKNDKRQTFVIKARNVSEETEPATNLNSTINAYNNVGHENARTEVPTTSQTDVPKISDLNSLQTSFPAASLSTQAVKVAKIPRCQAISAKLESENFVKGSSQLQYKAYKRKLPEKVCEESDPNFSRRKTHVVKDRNGLTVTSYTKILPDENESRFLSEENSKSQDHLIFKNDKRQTFVIKARNVSEETEPATNLNSTINAYNNGAAVQEHRMTKFELLCYAASAARKVSKEQEAKEMQKKKDSVISSSQT